MRKFLMAATAVMLSGACVSAQDVTLRVHHFMGEKAPLHSKMLVPWAADVAEKSGGTMEVQIFPSMSLGGGPPPTLYDQAADGAVDIVLTLPGYTSGRFNNTEVFELPFLMEDSVATSRAFWDLIDSGLQEGEFDEVQVLSGWVHGPGVVHSKTPIAKLEDLAGVELRGPTRLATDLIAELGGTPVGMPLPAIPENLSKGVISATLLPWEVTPSIKLAELVSNHTEIGGDRALYTAAFILAMNIDIYDGLSDDQRAVLDETTGKAMAEFASSVMVGADAFGRSKAEGNNFIVLDEAEVARWIEASQPVYDRWIARATKEGFDGEAAIAKAKELIAANQ